MYLVLLFSYISILLVTLSSSILYYFQIHRQIVEQTELSRQLLLTKLESAVEAGTGAVEKSCMELAFQKSILQYAKGFTGASARDIEPLLSAQLHTSESIYDYFIYIKSTDEIITSSIRMSSRKFYDLIYPLKHMSYRTFKKTYLDSVHFQEYMPIQTLAADSNENTRVLPFIQSFPIDSSQKPTGQIICYIDVSKLFADIDPMHKSTGSDIYILNEKHRLVTGSANPAPLDIAKAARIASGKETRGYILSKRTAKSTGWIFITRTPTSQSFSESRGFLLRSAAIFVTYLIIGLILVRYLARKCYTPLLEIKHLIKTRQTRKVSDCDDTNEFDTIKGTLLAQYDERQKLSGIIDSLLPDVRRAVLDRILKGRIDDDSQLRDTYKDIGLDFPSENFLLVAFTIATDSPFLCTAEAFDENLLLAHMIVSNVGNELFEKGFAPCYVDYEQQQGVFILCVKDASCTGDVYTLVENAVTKLLTFIGDTYQIQGYAGISTLHHSIEDIPLCFDEARKASEYSRLVLSTEPMLFCNLIQLKNNYYYPSELEFQLVDSLKTGEFGNARNLLDKVFDYNTQLSPNALKGLLFDIHATLSKQLQRMQLVKGEDPTQREAFDPAVFSSISEARVRFGLMIDRIEAFLPPEPADSRPGKLSRTIADYITKHAATQWIDLHTLSEAFHVTPQYISNVFKKHQKENVKDFISKAKLEAAKQMLLTSNLSVGAIARELGYAGEIGIIRLFKKYENTTPGCYRTVHSRRDVS